MQVTYYRVMGEQCQHRLAVEKAASDNASHVIRPVVEIIVSDNDDYSFLILVTLEGDDIASRRLEYTHSDLRWCNNIVVFDGSLFGTTHSQTYVLSLCVDDEICHLLAYEETLLSKIIIAIAEFTTTHLILNIQSRRCADKVSSTSTY
jgi:hypothetical protein